MSFTPSLWKKAKLIFAEHNWNHTELSRERFATLLGVSDRRAGELLFALRNYDVITETAPEPEPAQDGSIDEAEFVRYIKQAPKSIIDIADRFDIAPKAVNELVMSLLDRHIIVSSDANMVMLLEAIPKQPPLTIDMKKHGSNQLILGGVADTHFGSKYERLDVLNSLYDRFADAGVTHVYHGGNWIDGEKNFNKTDIYCHGLGNQVDNFIQKYPHRKGIKTYIISGDDHEGWYVQRENINIGSFMQDQAVKAGRDDLIDAGYMERDFVLQQRHGSATLRLIHAGGGSAYAVSYTSQKYVECVPLDSEILTKDGWKRYDQLQIGELVLGYNQETDKNEWTPIVCVNVFKNKEVVRYENSDNNFTVDCTENHRWALEHEKRGSNYNGTRYTYPPIKELAPLTAKKARTRIVQAAVSPDGEGLNIDFDGLLDRKYTEKQVLSMTSGERRAFISGFLVGEGGRSGGQYKSIGYSQRPGFVNDAAILACFLEGIPVACHESGKKCADGWHEIKRCTLLRTRKRFLSSIKEIDRYITDVWCPTTQLGTWVMRQGNLVTITGNSLQGGEKPQIVLVGHYHKFEYGYPREVHTLQLGCCQDQTPFMRKRKLQAMVGGCIIRITQADNGIITSFAVEWLPYYDKKFYEYRW